jgi:heat shock protein HtpX
VIIALVFAGSAIYTFVDSDQTKNPGELFLNILPLVIIGVGLWFFIAYNIHTGLINKATGSKPLGRKENKRVFNLVENLCISTGMSNPKINIIDDDSLNAFASGLNEKSYSISLSKGIIEKLDEKELEGVIAHELTHIRNRDVRLLVVSIIFVGIFAFITHALLRSMRFRRGGGGDRNGAALIIVLVLSAVGWLLTSIFRFALSRKREYLADAGAVELTRNPGALASALRKVSQDSRIEAVTRKDVAQLFIENPGEKKKSMSFSTMFATHPPINDRIAVLEQY